MSVQTVRRYFEIWYGKSGNPIEERIDVLTDLESKWNGWPEYISVIQKHYNCGIPFQIITLMLLEMDPGVPIQIRAGSNGHQIADIIRRKAAHAILNSHPVIGDQIPEIISVIVSRSVQLAGIYRWLLKDRIDEFRLRSERSPLSLNAEDVLSQISEIERLTDLKYVTLIETLYAILRRHGDVRNAGNVYGHSIKYWVQGADMEIAIEEFNEQSLDFSSRADKYRRELEADQRFNDEVRGLVHAIGIGRYSLTREDSGEFELSETSQLLWNGKSKKLSDRQIASLDDFCKRWFLDHFYCDNRSADQIHFQWRVGTVRVRIIEDGTSVSIPGYYRYQHLIDDQNSDFSQLKLTLNTAFNTEKAPRSSKAKGKGYTAELYRDYKGQGLSPQAAWDGIKNESGLATSTLRSRIGPRPKK